MEKNNERIYQEFERRNRQAELGGGEEKLRKRHEAGRMTARERIEMLLDKGTFVELDKFVTHRCTNYGMDRQKIPGDGIVSGYGKIDGRQVFVYAYDFTVFGGSLSITNANKIVKVQTMALKNGAPVIALNDSGGARIQEGVESLTGYSNIFFQNTIASGVVPQFSAILGPCAGGACYSPALTDFIFMVRDKSHMFVTGPDVVKAVTHEEVDKEELGGAYTHSSRSGVAHFMGESEEEVLMGIRELLSFLPSNNLEDAPVVHTTDDIRREDERLQTLIPADPNVPYDVKEVIGFNIPLITLEDVPGFLPGTTQEHGGIIRHGAKIVYAYVEATVPKITLILRKAYGGAYIVMSSKQTGSDVNLAYPTAEIAVMGAEGAVNILCRGAGKEQRREAVEEYEERFANPYRAAELGYIDEIILPKQTRFKLIQALEMAHNKIRSNPPKKHGNMPL